MGGGGGITPICTVFGLSLNVTLVIDFELGKTDFYPVLVNVRDSCQFCYFKGKIRIFFM